MTITNWIILGVIIILGGFFALVGFIDDNPMAGITIIFITILLSIALVIGVTWWHKNTADGIRAYKDYQSNIENGIEREITITAEDGREIFHYDGKVDVESNHTDNYIKFESEDGKRYIIYYGIQDTIIIKEK